MFEAFQRKGKLKMASLFALVTLAASAHAVTVEESVFDYSSRSYRVGEWNPPSPPSHESSGLEGKVPIPSDMASDFQFSTSNSVAFKAGSRKLLMAGAEAAKGSKVPHNWFGSGKYTAPTYDIATGKEECDVCKFMIEAGAETVEKAAGESAAEAGKVNLCGNIDPKYKDMCEGYQKYLVDCPSYQHNICHQDMGGSERLRAPCPEYLQCYYCLRINPLYCMA